MTRAKIGLGGESLLGKPGTSHQFDISNGEAFALRTLDVRGLRTRRNGPTTRWPPASATPTPTPGASHAACTR